MKEIIGYSKAGPLDQWGAKLSGQSAGTMTEQVKTSGVAAVAAGSPAVSVCELENLAESWLHRFYTTLEARGNLLYCREELLRLVEREKKRQPQENSEMTDGNRRPDGHDSTNSERR